MSIGAALPLLQPCPPPSMPPLWPVKLQRKASTLKMMKGAGFKQPLSPRTRSRLHSIITLSMSWNTVGTGLRPILSGLSSIMPKYKGPAPVTLPEPLPDTIRTSKKEIDLAISELRPAAWLTKTPKERVELLSACARGLVDVTKEVGCSLSIKKTPCRSSDQGPVSCL